MSTDLMIDIETLSLVDNAHLLSVGLVWWDKSNPEEEMVSLPILIPSLLQPKSVIDAGTTKWWMQQSREAQDVLIGNHDRQELIVVAETVHNAMHQARRIWAKGPDFDLVILRNFIRNYYDPTAKIDFWKFRDVRTILDLVPEAKDISFDGCKHNALGDAEYQTKQMQHAFKWLNTRT